MKVDYEMGGEYVDKNNPEFFLLISMQKKHYNGLTLVEHACSMTIEGIKKSTEKVTPGGDHIVGGHVVERDQCQDNPAIT